MAERSGRRTAAASASRTAPSNAVGEPFSARFAGCRRPAAATLEAPVAIVAAPGSSRPLRSAPRRPLPAPGTELRTPLPEDDLDTHLARVAGRACARPSRRPSRDLARAAAPAASSTATRSSSTRPTSRARWVADRFAPRPPDLRRRRARARGDVDVVRVLAARARRATPGARAASRPRRPAPATRCNPKLTFDQFVIGDANRFAHAAALAVAELPGQAYNPLFLYGPPGVGKTHLLHSIANYVQRARRAACAVRYTTAEPSPTSSSPRCSAGDIDRFKARYRGNDVLLIDDVQFLERKAKTEEEFFHTFNALYDTGGQLVLTSDRLPRDIDGPRGAPARALRVRPRRRHHRARPRHAPRRSCASARSTTASELDRRRRARRHRRPRRRQRPRARGRAHPRRRLRTRSPRRDRSTPALAAEVLDEPLPDTRAAPCAAAHGRRDIQDAHLRGLRPHPRRAPLRQPRRPRRLAAPGRHVPRARAHRRRPCRPSARRFGGRNHTTVLTPAASARPSASPPTPSADEVVRTLDHRARDPRRRPAATDTLCTRPRRPLCAMPASYRASRRPLHISTAPMTPVLYLEVLIVKLSTSTQTLLWRSCRPSPASPRPAAPSRPSPASRSSPPRAPSSCAPPTWRSACASRSRPTVARPRGRRPAGAPAARRRPRRCPADEVTLELRAAEQDVEIVSGTATLPHPHAARRGLPAAARAGRRRRSSTVPAAAFVETIDQGRALGLARRDAADPHRHPRLGRRARSCGWSPPTPTA